MTNLNPSQKYAMYGSSLSESDLPLDTGTVTVPIPKRTGGPFFPYAPGNEEYNVLKPDDKQGQPTPTWVWIAIAAAGGLVLYYIIK